MSAVQSLMYSQTYYFRKLANVKSGEDKDTVVKKAHVKKAHGGKV
jgi:hypothetical protein